MFFKQLFYIPSDIDVYELSMASCGASDEHSSTKSYNYILITIIDTTVVIVIVMIFTMH